jgi:DNA replication protein DnaC
MSDSTASAAECNVNGSCSLSTPEKSRSTKSAASIPAVGQSPHGLARAITRITRADLIVIDDIGMLPAGQAAAEALHRVVDAAYERRSVVVTSNLHPSGFDTIMPKTLATATVDRLLHHAHIVLTEGSSLRLADATSGRGVMPLT